MCMRTAAIDQARMLATFVKRAGCDFRHTDFVELTAPLLKSEVLQLVLRDCRSCIQDKSDWGLDMMWCKYASKRLKNQACALIDSAPVVHLDWGLAPISQDFYRALHAVQATYGAYWSDHRVLDCKRRGEGLVEIPEDIEMGARIATSSKKRQSKPAKAENSTRQKAGKAAKDNEADPPEEDVGDDGLPMESQSKDTEGDGDGSDNSEESSPGSEEEEEEDNEAAPSRKTGKATRTGNNASSEASPSKKSKSSKTSSSSDSSWASEADGGKRGEADGSDEETQDEDTGVDTGRPSRKSDSDEESSPGSEEEEEE
ncbi:ACP5, partial [Symbiodinium microadriaticum]